MSGRKKNAEFVISMPIMSNQGRDRNRDLQFEGGKHFSLHAEYAQLENGQKI